MTITTEQLCELTAAINDSFNEFERDGVPVFRTLMPGQVRLILAKVDEWRAKQQKQQEDRFAYEVGYEEGYEAAKRETPPPSVEGEWGAVVVRPTFSVDYDEFSPDDPPAPDDSPHGFYAGPPPPFVPEPVPIGLPVTNGVYTTPPGVLDYVAANPPFSANTEPVAPVVPRRPGRPRTIAEADELEAELSAVIVALQAMAIDGAMRPILTWDNEKPEALPRWEAIQRRHEIASWAKMAELANLSPHRDRRQVQSRERNKPGPKPGSGKTPRLDEICAELVRQSVGTGIMPSMNTFDAARPSAWPLAWGIARNLGTSWNALAVEAGLKPRPLGRPVRADAVEVGALREGMDT